MSAGEDLVGLLRYVTRPPGQAHAVGAAARVWDGAADGIRESTDRFDRELARVIGPRWDAPDAHRLLGSWELLRADAREAEQLLRSVGAELRKLSRSIEDAQHQWDVAIASLAVAVGVSVGLGFVTFGLADAAAVAAAEEGATLMAGIAAWLEGMLQGSGVMFLQLAESTAAVSARLVVNFSVNVASQSLAGAITSPDHSFLHVHPQEAVVFAGLDTHVAPSIRAALPGTTPGWAIEAATSMTADGLAQLTGPDHRVNPIEMLLSGGMGAGSSKLLDRATERLRPPDGPTAGVRALVRDDGRLVPAGIDAARERMTTFDLPEGELGKDLLERVALKLNLSPASITPRPLEGGGLKGASRAEVWFIETKRGKNVAVAKVFPKGGPFLREVAGFDRIRVGTMRHVHTPKLMDAVGAVRGANSEGGVLIMTVAPGRPLDDQLFEAGHAYGLGRMEALSRLTKAMKSNGRAFGELHTRPHGSGGPVGRLYIQKAVAHLDFTVKKLQTLESIFGDGLAWETLKRRSKELGDGLRASPGVAALVHGDAHPGNIYYDPLRGTALIDLPNLYYSMGEGGRPLGIPARDIGAYYQKVLSFGIHQGLQPDELAELLETFMTTYRRTGAQITAEGTDFYRSLTALGDLERASRAFQAVRGRRTSIPGGGDLSGTRNLEQDLYVAVRLAKEAMGIE